MKSLPLWIVLIIMVLSAGCSPDRLPLPEPPPPPPVSDEPDLDYRDVRNHSYRTRSNIPVDQNRYEGSLWQDEASWGNLLRDHRARFRNDVLTIVNLPEIISVPESKDAAPAAPVTPVAAAGEGAAAQANAALDAIAAATNTGISAEEEQNDVLRSLKDISARVMKVLPNGNMVIVGEKVDYRQQNTIRYVTKITGIIRPEDVADNNSIKALKLARSEVQIKRQVMAKSLNLKALAPVVGRQKAGLFDRLGHLATPKTGGRVGTK